MCGLASSSAPVDPASITLQPPAGTDELRKHLEEILSQQLERLIPLHLERLLPACLERISAVNGNGAGSAPHDILVQQPDEEEVLPLGDEEDVKMQEQFVASLVKIEASARHAATSASASSSKVQGAEVIDLCDSVPDTDLEDEDDDTQEMMKNRPRLSKKLAHFLMAKKASTISELDDAIEVEVAALSMSTEEIRSEILRRLQLIPEKLWHKGPRRRPNVLRPEERRRGSNQLILGLITSGSFQKLPTISNETWMFPNLTKLILVYLDRLAKDQGWTKLPKCTTIQVTYNLETQLHVDGNNGGTSFGTSVGDHAGGKVFLSDAQGDEIWRLEEDIRRVGKEGDKIRGRRETTKDRLVEFDGNQIHGTCPFTGTRYAIILFGLSPSAVEETAELNKAYLTEMGFHYFDFVPRASERDLARRAAHDAAAGEDLKYEPPGKVPPPMRPHKRQKLADV